MNDNLEKLSIIKKEKLSETDYLETLLKIAYEKNMISEDFISNIQMQLLELLKIKSEKYNLLDSSSIKVDVAKTIMKSNIYAIGIYLKKFTPEKALEELKNIGIKKSYENGRKIIDRKISVSKILYKKVLTNKINTKNETYNSTILAGIKGFFKVYNPDYEADDMKITADYPLYNNLFGKVCGIEFIEKYLENVYIENEFCKLFETEKIERFLESYVPGYEEALVNIFKIVLKRVVECILADRTVSELTMDENDFERIKFKFCKKSKKEIYEIIYKTIDKIEIDNDMIYAYIKEGFADIQFEIYTDFENEFCFL